MSRISERYIRRLIKEAVINEVEKAEKIAQAAEDVIKGLSLNDDSPEQVISRAKRYAGTKKFTYVRDVNDEYIYAAIGGDLSIENFAPEYFVCVHDGVRLDKNTLGYKFKPTDKGAKTINFDDFLAVDPATFNDMPDKEIDKYVLAAQALQKEYGDMNTYQYIVFKVKNRTLPAADLIANTPPNDEVPAAQNAAAIVAAAVSVPQEDGSGRGVVDVDTPPGTPPVADPPQQILINPKPAPWWRRIKIPTIKLPKIRFPKFRKGDSDEDGGGPDDRDKDRERKRAEKRGDKERSAAAESRWNEAWKELTKSEKKLFVALVNDDPNVGKIAADAIKRGEYDEVRFGEVLNVQYPTTFMPAGSTMLRDPEKVRRFQGYANFSGNSSAIYRVTDKARFSGTEFGNIVQKYPRLIRAMIYGGAGSLPEEGGKIVNPTEGPFKDLFDGLK